MQDILLILQSIIIKNGAAFLTSFLISITGTPVLIQIAKDKRLQDTPNYRKSHTKGTPAIGGVAIFAGVLFSFTFWATDIEFAPFKSILIALVVIFLTGLKDDIIGFAANKKFIAQIFATMLIILFSDQIQLKSLHGIFGIYTVPDVVGWLLTFVTILGITNSFNLLDGIDGLATGAGIITATAFGIILLEQHANPYSILAFSLTGALLAFLFFNYEPAKIFLGDTGALVIGFIISLLAIKFIEINSYQPEISQEMPYVQSAPAVAVGFLMLPLFDTLRVFIMRILKGRSPFASDQNHIHHILLRCGLSHSSASWILYGVILLFIGESLLLQNIGSMNLLIVLILTAFILLGILLKAREMKRKSTKKYLEEK